MKVNFRLIKVIDNGISIDIPSHLQGLVVEADARSYAEALVAAQNFVSSIIKPQPRIKKNVRQQSPAVTVEFKTELVVL